MVDSVISIGAILGVLLSIILGHRLAVSRERRKEIRAAVAEFKDSFVTIMSDLTESDANPTLLITNHFSAHKAAAVKLQGTLPKRRAKKFLAAWAEYQAFHADKKSLGTLGAFAAEVTDPSRAHDPEHIYEVNALRRNEALATIKALLNAADL